MRFGVAVRGNATPPGAAHFLRAFIPIVRRAKAPWDLPLRHGHSICARAKFGAGRLLVSDSRLTLGALNYARHQALHRVFGVSRAEANLLTFVLALGAVDPAARVARRVVRAPRVLTGAGSAMSELMVREGRSASPGPACGRVRSSRRCWRPR